MHDPIDDPGYDHRPAPYPLDDDRGAGRRRSGGAAIGRWGGRPDAAIPTGIRSVQICRWRLSGLPGHPALALQGQDGDPARGARRPGHSPERADAAGIRHGRRQPQGLGFLYRPATTLYQ